MTMVKLPEDESGDLEKKVVCDLSAAEWSLYEGLRLYKPCGVIYEIGEKVLCAVNKAYKCEFRDKKYMVKLKRREE